MPETHERPQERTDSHDHEHEHEHQHSTSAVLTEVAANPVFVPGKPDMKILVSPGTGAGWVTYAPHGATDNFCVWMLTYEPLIRGLEKGDNKGT